MERIRLDEHTLQIELTKQPLEYRTLVVITCGVASLSDRDTQSCGVQRHLGDERRTATTGGHDRTSQGLAVTDQLIKNRCPTWDLSDRPVTDGGADGSDIHLQEEVAESGIGGRTLEPKAKRLCEHIVMAPGKTLQIPEALAFIQDPVSSDICFWSSADTKSGPADGLLMESFRCLFDRCLIGVCRDVVVVGCGTCAA